jgi:hypothetical protein
MNSVCHKRLRQLRENAIIAYGIFSALVIFYRAMAKRKNPAAVALGRKGGKAKVAKGFSALTDEQRSAVAKRAAAARWKKGGEK